MLRALDDWMSLIGPTDKTDLPAAAAGDRPGRTMRLNIDPNTAAMLLALQSKLRGNAA